MARERAATRRPNCSFEQPVGSSSVTQYWAQDSLWTCLWYCLEVGRSSVGVNVAVLAHEMKPFHCLRKLTIPLTISDSCQTPSAARPALGVLIRLLAGRLLSSGVPVASLSRFCLVRKRRWCCASEKEASQACGCCSVVDEADDCRCLTRMVDIDGRSGCCG